MNQKKPILIISILIFLSVSCIMGDFSSENENEAKTDFDEKSSITIPTVFLTELAKSENFPPTTTETLEGSPTVSLEPTSTKTLEPTPTIHGVQNPSGIITAGMPVIIENYVMVVDKSGMTIDGDFIGFEILIKVIGDESRLFRYNTAALKLRDDLGNYYDYYYNLSFSEKCKESDLYNPKQIQMEPFNEIVIEPQSSMMYASYFWWCLENHNTDIPGFFAVIPQNAKSLFLEFDGFGPFNDFSYEFKL